MLKDANGNDITPNDYAHFGEMCDIDITKLEYILFANETGCNTNQKNNEKEGGWKFIIQQGSDAKNNIATNDLCYTLFPMTAGNGKLVAL